MTLSQLNANYVKLRDLAEGARDKCIETKDMHYCKKARFFRAEARITRREIRKIENRILIKKLSESLSYEASQPDEE